MIERMENKNTTHFCICGKYIGHRGYCSQECHDKAYDDLTSLFVNTNNERYEDSGLSQDEEY